MKVVFFCGVLVDNFSGKAAPEGLESKQCKVYNICSLLSSAVGSIRASEMIPRRMRKISLKTHISIPQLPSASYFLMP
jgi:hypothetical protein